MKGTMPMIRSGPPLNAVDGGIGVCCGTPVPVAAGGDAGVIPATGVPHFPQNRESGTRGSPHSVQNLWLDVIDDR